MAILAIPIFYLELSLGQRFKKGPVQLWYKLCPPLAGIGIGSIMCSWYITIYYQLIVGWCFYYLYLSFYKEIPYAHCPCKGQNAICNITAPDYIDECVKTSPTTYYWYRIALNISDGIEYSGTFNWKMLIGLCLAWIISYCIMKRGLDIWGKVFVSTIIIREFIINE